MGDQPVTRPLPTHRTTKHTINAHNTHIHALSGIRIYDPSVQASEVSSWFRPRSHCDWLVFSLAHINIPVEGIGLGVIWAYSGLGIYDTARSGTK
jgi:hypothetical protein